MANANLIDMEYTGDRSASNLTPQMPSGKRYQYGGAQGYIQADPRDVETLQRLQFQPRQSNQAATEDSADQDQQAGESSGSESSGNSSGEQEVKGSPDFLTEAGISQATAQNIFDAGFTNADLVKNASDEQLLAVEGVGPSTLEKLRAI